MLASYFYAFISEQKASMIMNKKAALYYSSDFGDAFHQRWEKVLNYRNINKQWK